MLSFLQHEQLPPEMNLYKSVRVVHCRDSLRGNMDKTRPGLVLLVLYTLMPGPAGGWLCDLGIRLYKQQTGGLPQSSQYVRHSEKPQTCLRSVDEVSRGNSLRKTEPCTLKDAADHPRRCKYDCQAVFTKWPIGQMLFAVLDSSISKGTISLSLT